MRIQARYRYQIVFDKSKFIKTKRKEREYNGLLICIQGGGRKMKRIRQEVRMKKMLIPVALILLISPGTWSETQKARQYVNLSFIVWRLENGAEEAISRINTPIPELFKESWICEFVTFDVSDRKAATKIVEKAGLRFVLTADFKDRLTILVYEKENELFRFIHNRPSTANYIFYGSDHKTYLMEAAFTSDNHPIGLLSPGIKIIR
jgi:hypothetical protein